MIWGRIKAAFYLKVLDIRFLPHMKIWSFLVSKMYVLFQYDIFLERYDGFKRARYAFTRFHPFHLKRRFETKESIQFTKEISGMSLMFTKRSVFSAMNGFSRNKNFCFYWNRSSHPHRTKNALKFGDRIWNFIAFNFHQWRKRSSH